MTVFLVTVDDGENEYDADDIREAVAQQGQYMPPVSAITVEQIEVIHSEADGKGRGVTGLSYRVTDAA